MCLCLGLAVILASAAAITTTYFITRGSPLGRNGKHFIAHQTRRFIHS